MQSQGERARGSKKGLVERWKVERQMKWEDKGKAELESYGDTD